MNRKKDLIVARIHDGLGNQLFIYAAARRIADARGAELLLDVSSAFARDRKYGAIPQLRHFAIKASFAPQRLCFSPRFGRHVRDVQNSYSKHVPLRHRFAAWERDFDALCTGAPSRHIVRLEGYWQSERYFAPIADEIANELCIVSPLSEISLAMAERISATRAVCLHVRQMHGVHHGAFAQPPPSHSPRLPFSYYEQAVEQIAKRVENPTFFCFADNFDGIRERWKFPYPIHFVDHNRERDHAYEDLALMSLCRHFVIGNSTFSWWGAWLARSREKIVIAPANRGKFTWSSEADVIPENWQVLAVEGA